MPTVGYSIVRLFVGAVSVFFSLYMPVTGTVLIYHTGSGCSVNLDAKCENRTGILVMVSIAWAPSLAFLLCR
jgi:hypothetical protein